MHFPLHILWSGRVHIIALYRLCIVSISLSFDEKCNNCIHRFHSKTKGCYFLTVQQMKLRRKNLLKIFNRFIIYFRSVTNIYFSKHWAIIIETIFLMNFKYLYIVLIITSDHSLTAILVQQKFTSSFWHLSILWLLGRYRYLVVWNL